MLVVWCCPTVILWLSLKKLNCDCYAWWQFFAASCAGKTLAMSLKMLTQYTTVGIKHCRLPQIVLKNFLAQKVLQPKLWPLQWLEAEDRYFGFKLLSVQGRHTFGKWMLGLFHHTRAKIQIWKSRFYFILKTMQKKNNCPLALGYCMQKGHFQPW